MGVLAWASSSDAFCFASAATPGRPQHVSNAGAHTQNMLLKSTASSSHFREEDPKRPGPFHWELSRRGEPQCKECPVKNWRMPGTNTSLGSDASLAPWVSVRAERRRENKEKLQSPGGFQQGAPAFSMCANLACRRQVVTSPLLWFLLLNPLLCSLCLGEGKARVSFLHMELQKGFAVPSVTGALTSAFLDCRTVSN